MAKPSNLKSVFKDIRNHLVGMTTGITRDEAAREVIRVLDGGKDRRAVAHHIGTTMAKGKLAIGSLEDTPDSGDTIQEQSQQLADKALDFMARSALLVN